MSLANVGQVQGFIKTGVCRGATYLEMAPGAQAADPKADYSAVDHALGRLKLTLPQPLNMEDGMRSIDRNWGGHHVVRSC